MKRICSKLNDWRTEDDVSVDPKPEPTVVEISTTRIDVKFLNERSIWIEQENGDIKVRCYGPDNDEPTSIILDHSGLTILPP